MAGVYSARVVSARKPGGPSISAPADGLFHLIDTPDVAEIALGNLRGAARLAVDCEGVDLSRRGRLCLVQVADPEDPSLRVYAFDVVALRRLPTVRAPSAALMI
eukprot:tig00021680_g23033.t1